MTPFGQLGLPADADERAIKRAYARLLRQCRPDEDAAAFQRLNDAYQHCLMLARRRALAVADVDGDAGIDTEDAPLPARDDDAALPARAPQSRTEEADGAPHGFGDGDPHVPDAAHIPETRSYDAGPFLRELWERLQDDDAAALRDWLWQQEDLYSLSLRDALRPHVVEMLVEGEPPPMPEPLEVVLEFFGLDALLGDRWLAEQVRTASERSEAAQAFVERTLSALKSKSGKPVDRLLLRELMEPMRPARRWLLMLCPTLPGRLRATLLDLQQAHPAMTRRHLDGGSLAFWLQATDRARFARPRWALLVSRWLLYGLLAAWAISRLSIPTAPLLDVLPRTLGWIVIPWLLYAVALAGLIRLREWNRSKRGWDESLALTLALAGGLTLLGLFLPWLGNLGFLILAMVWIAPRSGGAYWLAFALLCLAALFTGTLLVKLDLARLAGDRMMLLVPLSALGLLLGHDRLLAHRHRLAMPQARRSGGWLGLWSGGLAAALAAMLLLFP